MADDNIQHGIDDNPSGDAEKGAALGGLGGAVVGGMAGSLAGPIGTVIGAVVGGLGGAGASGAAVAAVDQVDNDNTITGIGSGATGDVNTTMGNMGTSTMDPGFTGGTGTHTHADGTVHSNTDDHLVTGTTYTGMDTSVGGHNVVTGGAADTNAGETGLAGGAVVGGVIGAAVGGPVGAVVGGTLGSLAGGVAGDAAEAEDEGKTGTMSGTTPIV